MNEAGRSGAPRSSSRTLRLLLALVAFALVAAGAAALAAGPAAAKDFSITSVAVDAQVMPNGDVRITDTRTLDFSGTYHFVYWDLSTKGADAIKVLGASGPSSSDPSQTVPVQAVADTRSSVRPPARSRPTRSRTAAPSSASSSTSS